MYTESIYDRGDILETTTPLSPEFNQNVAHGVSPNLCSGRKPGHLVELVGRNYASQEYVIWETTDAADGKRGIYIEQELRRPEAP